MSRRWLPGGLALVAAALLAGAAPAGRPTIEGVWSLSDQARGERGEGAAPPFRPLTLELTRQGPGLAARVWLDGAQGPLPWPAFSSEGVLRPLVLEEQEVGGAFDSIRVRYRIEPLPPDGRGLRILESYRLTEAGRALIGIVRVTALEGETERGSYVIHRRFERRP